jgi:dephospho-CoA kinase
VNAAALTGGIASGKTAAAGFIEAAGIPVFDTDHAAAHLTMPGGRAIPALSAAFGEECLDASGALNRPRMRDLVFKDSTQKRKLETILHPMIREEVESFLEANRDRRCVVSIPLYFETLAYRGRFREVACIDCPTSVQVRRLVDTRGLDEDLARRIVESQVPRKIRLQLADCILVNHGSLGALKSQMQEWLGSWS